LFYQYSDGRICFFQLQPGGDRNFSYLLGDSASGEAVAVDPGFNPGLFHFESEQHGLSIRYILLTHGHGDHADAAAELATITGATVYAGKDDGVEAAVDLIDGDRLSLGKSPVDIIATPGHTPGHYSFLFENRLMTGDLLFCGKVGGTGNYFPGSSAEAEWHSLKKIMKLPGEVMVFPGHDYYGGEGTMPHSTISYERRHNPFLLCSDFEEFRKLKENWAEYKAKHNIQ